MTSSENLINPVNVISASAGTGKTYRLSSEYVKGLKLLRGNAGIIATTFTNKAADELIERVRRFLLRKGEWQAAQSVLSGYLGTVNSICGRLVSDHAIEAGLSPDFTVISEDRLPVVFAIAVDTVIHEFADEMHDAASRMQIENWRGHVREIIDHARNNNLGVETLNGFAESSWTRLQALLAPLNADETSEMLDARLAAAVDMVLEQLKSQDDGVDKTAQAIDFLQEVNRRLKSNKLLIWQVWARLSKLQVGNECRRLLQPLTDAALAHSRHPRLHEDLKTVIFSVFGCAAAALQQYATFKRDHGLIDFVDQEHLAFRMLKRLPEVRESFKQRTQVLLVDEFQDTSPIQLAVFLEMARLVDYSVWVGDEKQSIFGFRGSDPELMRQAMAQIVPVSNGEKHRLVRSYRSRPSLVAFTNALFSKCSNIMKITSGSAVVDEVERTELDQQNQPLHLWWLRGGQRQQADMALARAVADVIAQPDDWMVADKEAKALRPIRGSDIAILCRSNDHRIAVARALSTQGLTVATERDSLLDAAECVFSVAALRLLVDESDTLAIAEIANLLCPQEEQWLDSWLSSSRSAVEESLPCISKLKAARSRLYDRTPCEALEMAINEAGVIETAMTWGNVRQRLANLDALRGLARGYEDICLSAKIPATPAGLVVYIEKNVRDGGSQPANPDENGIHVLTYHKSKGLEWPLVILYDLDSPARGSPFNITVESAQTEIDPLNPLQDRAIRYWPWPYGNIRTGVHLQEKAAKTKEAALAGARDAAENLRLLYVGMTRARDYLILAARPTPYGTAWLNTLVDEHNLKLLTLPVRDEVTEEEIIDGVRESRTRIENKSVPEAQSLTRTIFDTTFVPAPCDRLDQVFSPFHLSPSGATTDDFSILHEAAHSLHSLGERIAFTGNPDMPILGDCVHAFFAVDDTLKSESERLLTARRILSNWKVDNLTPDQLIEAANRLRNFAHTNFPQSSWHTEVPVSGRIDQRRVSGTIDLLLDCEQGYVIIDHKTFPGRFEEWQERALSHSHQLALYRHLVEQATGKPVTDTYIHMPILGAIIRIDCRLSKATAAQSLTVPG